jgi:hypothetical protein
MVMILQSARGFLISAMAGGIGRDVNSGKIGKRKRRAEAPAPREAPGKSVGPITGYEHAVAGTANYRRNQVADQFFIIGYQNGKSGSVHWTTSHSQPNGRECKAATGQNT